MARLVVDLEKKMPYSIRANANVITIVFDAPSEAVSGAAPERAGLELRTGDTVVVPW